MWDFWALLCQVKLSCCSKLIFIIINTVYLWVVKIFKAYELWKLFSQLYYHVFMSCENYFQSLQLRTNVIFCLELGISKKVNFWIWAEKVRLVFFVKFLIWMWLYFIIWIVWLFTHGLQPESRENMIYSKFCEVIGIPQSLHRISIVDPCCILRTPIGYPWRERYL